MQFYKQTEEEEKKKHEQSKLLLKAIEVVPFAKAILS